MAKKSTNIEIDERINTVYKLLLEGNSRTQILQYGADTWDLKDRQVEEYIKEPVITSASMLRSWSAPSGCMSRCPL